MRWLLVLLLLFVLHAMLAVASTLAAVRLFGGDLEPALFASGATVVGLYAVGWIVDRSGSS